MVFFNLHDSCIFFKMMPPHVEVQEAPRDVAIDSKHQKIYWTALCCGLRRADLDGKNEEVATTWSRRKKRLKSK